jgi:hypothetical protein
MSKTFNTAIEASHIIMDLRTQLRSLPYNADLHRLANNIGSMVRELSQLEVYARRTPPRSRYHVQFNAMREEMLSAIKQLENLMLIARLMA